MGENAKIDNQTHLVYYCARNSSIVQPFKNKMMKSNSSKGLTLREMFEHLKELSDNKADKQFFETAYSHFKYEVLMQEKLSDFYIARGYLKSLEKGNEKITGLDISEVLIMLQNRIDHLLSKRTDVQKKHPVMTDAHIAQMSGALN